MNQPLDPDGADRDRGSEPAPPTGAAASGEPMLRRATAQIRIAENPFLERQRALDFYRHLFELTPRVLATKALVAANVVVFVLMALSTGALLAPDTDALIAWGSNFGPSTLDGQWWRLLTSMFLHVGVIHIAFNMWVLWDAGQLVERLVGSVGFVVLYMISGLSGSLASVYWNPYVNSAGASGAVFGVFGALLGFIVLRGDSVPKSLLRRLRTSGFTFLALNLAIGFSVRWIDNAAHIGGMAAGFACGLLMSQPLKRVTRARRALRNVAVLALGVAAILAAMHFAPEAPVDFSRIERQVVDVYNRAARQWRQKQITTERFAEILESEILPPWRAGRERLARPTRMAPARREFTDKLRRYAQRRQQEWEALLAALREPTPEHWQEHANQKKRADALLEQLNAR